MGKLIDRFFRRKPRSPKSPGSQSMAVHALARQIAHNKNLAARYDLAQTTPENVRHWENADGLSADAANSPHVRRIIRNRARYEVGHNSYLKSIVRKRANEVIGYGPMLQIDDESGSDPEFVASEFAEWCKAVRLPAKLHRARRIRSVDGESFLMLTSSRKLTTPVKLQLRGFEPERCATPHLLPGVENRVDGIDLDDEGDPAIYHILKNHPGSRTLITTAAVEIAARFILHSFHAEREEQHRGICEILSALPLGAYLRRYTLATISSAEIAALHSAVLESDVEPDKEDIPQPFEVLELDRGMLTVVPGQWKLNQMKSEQPTTVYPQFKDEVVNEMGAADSMPGGLAKGHSKGLNFASGRLDQIPWHLDVEIDQAETVSQQLDPILAAWLAEAATITGPPGYPIQFARPMPEHQWIHRGRERGTDETKTAKARDIDLKNGMTGYPAEQAKKGLNWKREQKRNAQSLGISVKEYRKLLREQLFAKSAGPAVSAPDDEDEDAKEEVEDEA